MIYAFFDFFCSKIVFDQKVSYCWDKFDYPGSIVYLSCFGLDLPLPLICGRVDCCYISVAPSSLSMASTKILVRKTILLLPCCIYLTSPGIFRWDGGSGVIFACLTHMKVPFKLNNRFYGIFKVGSQRASL